MYAKRNIIFHNNYACYNRLPFYQVCHARTYIDVNAYSNNCFWANIKRFYLTPRCFFIRCLNSAFGSFAHNLTLKETFSKWANYATLQAKSLNSLNFSRARIFDSKTENGLGEEEKNLFEVVPE